MQAVAVFDGVTAAVTGLVARGGAPLNVQAVSLVEYEAGDAVGVGGHPRRAREGVERGYLGGVERDSDIMKHCHLVALAITMTTVQITLPDALALEAANAGLFESAKMEHLLRERLRAERIDKLDAARAKLAAQPLAPMTPEEIQAEIDTYRTEQRRAAGT